MYTIPHKLFDQIIEFLAPIMSDLEDRKSLVQSALRGCTVLESIQWEGTARTFTIHLVTKLDQFGHITPGTPAIVALLHYVYKDVGLDRQSQITRFIDSIESSLTNINFDIQTARALTSASDLPAEVSPAENNARPASGAERQKYKSLLAAVFSPRLKYSKAAMMIALAVISAISLSYWALYKNSSLFETRESTDSLASHLVHWFPLENGWAIEQIGEYRGRRVRGEKMALFKSADKTNTFNVYKDFSLTFEIRFLNRAGAAWTLRARDFANYYLFELTTTQSQYKQRRFNIYKCINGELIPLQSLPVGDYLDDENNSFEINAEAIGNKIKHRIYAYSDDTKFHEIGEITDDAFPSGGVGLHPLNNYDVLLQQFVVIPK